jgi:outer membrane lipoprotein SlyB
MYQIRPTTIGPSRPSRPETIIVNQTPACLVLAGTLLLAACAETPMGPTIPVAPGPNTSFSQFQNDQAVCRNFAQQAVRDQAQGANLRGLGTAALTTALGAGLGAAVGGGRGAGMGAAAGALGGTGLAARNTSNANVSIQAQYNNAFAACMFSLGNSVPPTGPMMNRPAQPRQSGLP